MGISCTALITVPTLHDALRDGSIAVFDCGFDLSDPAAGLAAYRSGHIPGACYLHLDDDLSSPPNGTNGRHPLPVPEQLAMTLRRLGLKCGQQVVAYDDAGGAFAARLWWLLRWLGHENVAVLDGGRAAWIEAGLPLDAGEGGSFAEGDFAIRSVWHAGVVDAQAVLDNIGSGLFQLIDARSPERFRGEANAMDPVAGHIPGAGNRFFKDNLKSNGRFKSAEDLREDFRAVFEGREATDIVLQCGSGVTACHNALAMEIAGLSGARLYPGSWSEWILDRSRPVAGG